VTTGPGKSWKVMEFRKTIFQAWKVLENSKGHEKSWKISKHNVMEFYNCAEVTVVEEQLKQKLQELKNSE